MHDNVSIMSCMLEFPLHHEQPQLEPPVRMTMWCIAAGSSKEAMLPRMMDYAAAGYVGVAIDCRYHGARAAADAAGSARDGYQQALVRWATRSRRCLTCIMGCSCQTHLDVLPITHHICRCHACRMRCLLVSK
jgi:hypothetical protein